MLSKEYLNKNKTFLLINQIPNINSQFISYYMNLTQDLNINSPSCPLIAQIPLDNIITNVTLDNLNSGIILYNYPIINNSISMSNYINMFQMQMQYQHCSSNLTSNMYRGKVNKNENNLIEKLNLIGKKRNRKIEKDENNINIKKNDKNINGVFKENKNEGNLLKIDHSIDKEINQKENEQIHQIKKEFLLNIEKKNQNLENDFTNSKSKNKTQYINVKKKRNQYKELLKDTILEHLDNRKKDITIFINNAEYDKTTNEPKSKNIYKKEKNKTFTFNYSHRRYNHHFTHIKKTKSNGMKKYPSTHCIFHGDNYQKTNSVIDFMKYNYNFIEGKEKFKKIENADRQVVQVDTSKIIYNNNYENNKYYLSNIKPIWLRSEFKGDDSELISRTNFIKKKYKNRRDELNEEECLKQLVKNKYSL